MSLATKTQSPLDEIWVSLDLETTGLSAEDDDIIEIGAVKFRGNQELDTFQTFVNPHRELNDFVKGYTGITQAEVDGAPSFSGVAGKLGAFIGMAPVVGHNIGFDLGFLAQKGLTLGNPRSDTWDLAVVLFPALPDYSLGKLARSLGIVHPRPHRAVEDALVTRDVFLDLVTRLSQLDVYTLAEIRRLAERSSWSLSYVVDRVEAAVDGAHAAKSRVGVAGLDMEALAERLKRRKALRPNRQTEGLDVELVASLLRDGGPLSVAMPGFEEREEQVAMARAVGQAINGKTRLIVEAGTGVGKSLAYLLPAAIYALANNKRVVVSTNTINLQEQLLNKDIPILLRALADVPGVPAEELKFTQLKGRANYLCLRRWSHLRSSESLSENEARLMAKTLTWLQTSAAGDRSELNLAHRGSAAAWDRLSARGALECLGAGGPCFLRAARERAASSHLVIVNHALLLSDVAAEGSLIPDYDVLIVDEAHHLEEEATRHLGFELGQGRFDEYFRSLTGDRGLLNEAVTAFRGSSAADTRRRSVESTAAEAAGEIPRARDNLARMFATLEGLLSSAAADGAGAAAAQELRVTTSTRAQPAWSELEIQWEAVDLVLTDLSSSLRRLQLSLEGLEEAGLVGYQGLMMEMANAQQVNAELRQRLAEFVPKPRAEGIYWMTRNGRTGDLSLHAAPLQVGESLESLLYSRKECVVLTSATLSANGTFDHVRHRTGFEGSDDLLLGSPFDYPNAALLCVPEDIPEPSSPNYPLAAKRAIADAALAAGGRTMALFTSYAALQATAGLLRSEMEGQGISVLAQGSDGSPPQLIRRFVEDPRTVLLGTASFWEGVDFAGEALKVLLVMRLPFSVPSEPVFAARSELYEDPFNEYAVPNAILRLRQGFGRLIRTKTDRGVVVVMDRRLVSRKYGKAFVDSLPPVSFKTLELRDLGDEIRAWIDR